MAYFNFNDLTRAVRLAVLSAIGKLFGISFKVGELPYGAQQIIEPGDSL